MCAKHVTTFGHLIARTTSLTMASSISSSRRRPQRRAKRNHPLGDSAFSKTPFSSVFGLLRSLYCEPQAHRTETPYYCTYHYLSRGRIVMGIDKYKETYYYIAKLLILV